jgi:hypothetical protein
MFEMRKFIANTLRQMADRIDSPIFAFRVDRCRCDPKKLALIVDYQIKKSVASANRRF